MLMSFLILQWFVWLWLFDYLWLHSIDRIGLHVYNHLFKITKITKGKRFSQLYSGSWLFPYLFILNVYKILGLLYINDDYFLAYVSGIGFILAAIFRIILGKILDKYEWADVCEWTTATEIVLTLVYFYILEYKLLLLDINKD